MSEGIADVVTGVVEDFFGGTTEEAPAAEAEASAQEAEVAAETFPDWEAAGRDLFADDPEDIPDFDAEAELELAAESDDLAPAEFDDEQTLKLKKELLAERKRAEHFQRAHLTTARRAWETDVRAQPWAEFLPEDLSTIKATSHRDFNRQVKQIAKANYQVLKPHFKKLQAERERLGSQVEAEKRVEAEAAWGRPNVGGAQVPQTAQQQARGGLEEARRSRSMVKATKALIESQQI